MQSIRLSLLSEVKLAEDEIARVAPDCRVHASVIEMPAHDGYELRLHVEFASALNRARLLKLLLTGVAPGCSPEDLL